MKFNTKYLIIGLLVIFGAVISVLILYIIRLNSIEREVAEYLEETRVAKNQVQEDKNNTEINDLDEIEETDGINPLLIDPDWVTYTNDKYKFNISYPSEWIEQLDPGFGDRNAIFLAMEKPSKGTQSAGSVLVVKPVSGDLNLEQYILRESGAGYVPLYTENEIEFSDYGSIALIKHCESLCNYYYFHKIGDDIFSYVVSISENDVLADKISNTFSVHSSSIDPKEEVIDELTKRYSYKNLTIRFPQNWYVHDMKNDQAEDWGDWVFFASPDLEYIPARMFPAFRVGYKDNVAPVSFTEYKIKFEEDYNITSEFVTHKSIKLNGSVAYQSITNEEGLDEISTSIYRDGSLITISMEKQTDPRGYDLYNEILNTLVFSE